jgi:hypothetical protein
MTIVSGDNFQFKGHNYSQLRISIKYVALITKIEEVIN